MVFADLNASNFKQSPEFYLKEFEDILRGIITCYGIMLEDNIKLANNENKIRDEIIKYLKNNDIRERIQLKKYLFDREVPEDNSIGRTDIKIQTEYTFVDTSSYYSIECKRIDANNTIGITGLNAKYIENGIMRFTCGYYSTYNKTNSMIGFIVEPMDIHKNVDSINNLLSTNFIESKTSQSLLYKEIINDFKYSYCSFHKIEERHVVLYHLMFDFSNQIQRVVL